MAGLFPSSIDGKYAERMKVQVGVAKSFVVARLEHNASEGNTESKEGILRFYNFGLDFDR